MNTQRLLPIALALPLILALLVGAWIGGAAVIYSPEYVRRVLVWQESDVGDYLHNFPLRELTASSRPFLFAIDPREERVAATFQAAFGVDDFASFLTTTETQAFIVIQNDRVTYERYFNGWQRDSMLTSFSVAKSFVSTLVGLAVREGQIGSLEDPITRYLPELGRRDARSDLVTIRHLLQMAAGYDYQESRWLLFNGDDPLTTYHPDQRAISLSNTHIVAPPGQTFRYNKYHPQLLGLILERATGRSVTEWTQSRLWDPLGMEFGGAWALDSTSSGFEKMEAGLNARAIDFAKLGRLFLQQGQWEGQEILSPGWVAVATGADPRGRAPAFDSNRYYAYMWWGMDRLDGSVDFYAAEDHGQYVYVSPVNQVIIVRLGTEYGIPSGRWVGAFTRAADALGQSQAPLP